MHAHDRMRRGNFESTNQDRPVAGTDPRILMCVQFARCISCRRRRRTIGSKKYLFLLFLFCSTAQHEERWFGNHYQTPLILSVLNAFFTINCIYKLIRISSFTLSLHRFRGLPLGFISVGYQVIVAFIFLRSLFFALHSYLCCCYLTNDHFHDVPNLTCFYYQNGNRFTAGRRSGQRKSG